MADSDPVRLSVSVVDVEQSREPEFREIARQVADVLIQKGYGQAEVIRDETVPRRYYAVCRWNSAAAAQQSQADADVRALAAALQTIAHVADVVAGCSVADELFVERRSGRGRRVANLGQPGGERRSGRDRRRQSRCDLIAAARRAREHAAAPFSQFRVGAALEAADGTVITGCNIENATYGLTICAERVAMFKAISDGHRAFTRVAVVADTEAPTPPCGACRQILWEFGGNLEVVLANLVEEKGRYHLKDLLPLPFDARLL